VDDYYAGSCSADRIPDIKVPVLCVQADNDPIAPSHAIPFDRIKANENCILVTTPFGGELRIFRHIKSTGAPSTGIDSDYFYGFHCCSAHPWSRSHLISISHLFLPDTSLKFFPNWWTDGALFANASFLQNNLPLQIRIQKEV
jgi:hypothetical protein